VCLGAQLVEDDGQLEEEWSLVFLWPSWDCSQLEEESEERIGIRLDPDPDPFGSRPFWSDPDPSRIWTFKSGSGSEDTKIAIFLTFFVLKRSMNC
jgi:hypothetical protein